MEETKEIIPVDVPVLRGIVTDNGSVLNVWCPYCDAMHMHGWQPDHPAGHLEHRMAHCEDSPDPEGRRGSPFKAGGYFIGEIPGFGELLERINSSGKWRIAVLNLVRGKTP